MEIIHIAPPFLPLHENKAMGGIERFIVLLQNEQRRLGHSAKVIATSDSTVPDLLPTTPSIGLSTVDAESVLQEDIRDHTWSKVAHISEAYSHALQYPHALLHVQDDYFIPSLRFLHHPSIITIQTNVELFWKKEKYARLFTERTHLVCVSQRQKKLFENEGYDIEAVVHNGIPVEEFTPVPEKKRYLLTVGTIAPHKGQHLSLKAAKEAGFSLILAGEIGNTVYYDTYIKPIAIDLSSAEDKLAAFLQLPPGQHVVYAGKVSHAQKAPLFSNAQAFLMSTVTDEPFGIVAAESLAAGTPVIALNRGALPEIIRDGITGYLCRDEEEFIRSLRHLDKLSPHECRKDAEDRFSIQNINAEYMALYRSIS